jgi:Lar family restriction alleviation protein
MTEDEEIQPCPFCGRKDLIISEDLSEEDGTRYAYHVFCRDCHAHGGNNYPIGWCESKQMAIERWNDRSLQDNNIQECISSSHVYYFGELVALISPNNGEIVKEKLVYHLRPGDTIRVYRKKGDTEYER